MNVSEELKILFSDLNKTTIITPNRRLAAYLKKEYTSFCKQGKSFWEAPDILPLGSWLSRLWAQLEDQGRVSQLLLSPIQEWILWYEMLQNESSIIGEMQDALKMIKKWAVSYTHPDFLLQEDTAFFASCASRFYKTCEQNAWLSETLLTDVLIQNISARDLPTRLVFFEFDEIYPELDLLIKKIKSLGVRILQHHSHQKSLEPVRVKAPQPESEITLAARFALYQVLSNPEGCMAVVVPELTQNWGKINAIFKLIFQENLALDEPQPFSISAGQPLSGYPVVRCMLFLLKLVQSGLPTNEWIELLRSPFWGISRYSLSTIDSFISTSRRKKQTHWNTTHLPRGCFEEIKSERSMSIFEWTQWTCQILSALKWPGQRVLDSEEYQTVNRFKSLLEQIAGADIVVNKSVAWEVYFHSLFHFLETTLFQPESSDIKVQVLGVLEAAGLSFEKIWITGLSQNNWPPKGRPNPFIPLSLQREHAMPHASHQRELIYAKRVLEDFCRSATEVIVSWPGMDSDEPLLASSLITTYKEVDLIEIPQAPVKAPQIDLLERYGQQMETLENFNASPINGKILPGGASLLKEISACPFRAYSRYRLNAKALDPQSMEFTPQEKGILLHASLEGIWKELKDLEALKMCDDLDTLIENSIENAFLRHASSLKEREVYQLLEKEKLFSRVETWLSLEKERPYFRVMALEQEQTFSLGGAEISFRIDRIDELQDGSLLLMDYKSGITSLRDWFGTRPLAPQLPLYALANPKIKAMAFAEMSSKAIKLVGISNGPTKIEGILNFTDTIFTDAPHWEGQLDFWKKTFEQMVHQFRNGIAFATPAENKICKWCDFMSLCRNYENLR